jgi:hypothetical protein
VKTEVAYLKILNTMLPITYHTLWLNVQSWIQRTV